ncbi:MAG TPA: Maf family nucleotide pyrophosphatase [Aestuariivirgaceae bacterium]|jgi:septum formation protein
MNEEKVKLVLASASPRRLAILDQGGITPDLLNPVDIDETPKKREAARSIVQRLASAKARTAQNSALVRQLGGNIFILAADTAVTVGRRLLPKTETPEDAADCLSLLSGRAHRVYTAICLVTPKGRRLLRVVDTRVRFKRLTREEIESYLVSDEWRGKAGGYAIQGRAEAFVRHLNGSYTNVVGLPLYETINMLQGAGYPVYYSWMNYQPQ